MLNSAKHLNGHAGPLLYQGLCSSVHIQPQGPHTDREVTNKLYPAEKQRLIKTKPEVRQRNI